MSRGSDGDGRGQDYGGRGASSRDVSVFRPSASMDSDFPVLESLTIPADVPKTPKSGGTGRGTGHMRRLAPQEAFVVTQTESR
jgi:hypothetical protein